MTTIRPPRHLRRIAVACLAAVSAPVITLGAIAGQAAAALPATADRSEVAPVVSAATKVQAQTGGDSRTFPAIPTQPGSGPAFSGVDGVVLDGSLGLSTSLTPRLSWPGGPASGVTYEITNLAGERLWSSQGGASGVAVGGGALKQGGVYQWKATAGDRVHGPLLMRVDIQRNDVQPGSGYGGVSVAAATGEPSVAVSTRGVGTVGGEMSVGLAYRPSNAAMIAKDPGLPLGWELITPGDAQWRALRRVSPTRVVLYSDEGVAVPLVRTSVGAWRADFGRGQSWPAGTRAIVAQPVSPDGTAGEFQVTDASGSVTTFANPAVGARSNASRTWSARSPSYRNTFDGDGRLTKATDPVSGRSIDLTYGGSPLCTAGDASRGLKTAPAGLLCRIHLSDGGTTDIQYHTARPTSGALAGPLIARVIGDAQAGPSLLAQQDFGYDASGRLSAVRAPLTNSALAAGVLRAAGMSSATAANPALLTTVAYDARGRVTSITRPSALQAGVATVPARDQRTFRYSASGAGLVFDVMAPGRATPLVSQSMERLTMLTTRSVDAGGRVTSSTWNRANEQPETRTEPGGYRTTWTYDSEGRPLTTAGPALNPTSTSAPLQRQYYDTKESADPASSTRPSLTGLLATVWSGTSFDGNPIAQSVGPVIGGTKPATLAYSYSRPAPFSGRIEGGLVIPPAGLSQITSTVPSQQLWVNGEICDPTCPDSLRLSERKPGDILSIRVDVRSNANGTAAVGVSWTPKGGATTAIPRSALRPMLPNPTAAGVRDQLGPSSSVFSLISDYTFASGNPSQLMSARSSSGARAVRGYEGWDPTRAQYSRATKSTTPGGQEATTSYYAPGEAPRVSCPGAAQNQGGLPKHITVPGGLGVTNAYDSSGGLVGQESAGGVRTCITYDAVGRETRRVTTGAGPGGTGESVMAVEHEVGGNPLVSRVSYPGSGQAPSTTTADLLGRVVTTTDSWQTTAAFRYDEFDRTVASTVRTAAGESTTMGAEFSPDGALAKVSRDGLVLAEMAYQQATGFMTGVSYLNGMTVSLGYDGTGNASTRTVSVDGGSYTERATASPGGRTLTRSISGPGTEASWSYGYDRDGHLTSAALAGTAPSGVRTGTWVYEVNRSAQRTRVTSPYTAAGGFTYQYSAAGAITGTSDPRFAGGFAYDSQGRATKAGPLVLEYGPNGQATAIRDATGATERRTQLPDGTVTQTSITDAQGTTRTARYTLSGLILDTKGAITSQMVNLPGAVSVQLPPPGKDAGESTWRVGDMAGSVVMEFVGSRNAQPLALFDPDGNRLSGAQPSTDPGRPNLGYRGNQTAPLEIPVTHMGAREYVAALGIFLQSDPVTAAGNTAYGYANADPINMSDPSGGWAIFSGDWWKANWTSVVGIALTIVTSAVITAATGGLATAPFASAAANIALSVGKGVVAGAVSGAIVDTAVQGIEVAVGARESLDGARIGIAVGIGAATGALVGGLSWKSAAGKRINTLHKKLGGKPKDAPARVVKPESGEVWDFERLMAGGDLQPFGRQTIGGVRTSAAGRNPSVVRQVSGASEKPYFYTKPAAQNGLSSHASDAPGWEQFQDFLRQPGLVRASN